MRSMIQFCQTSNMVSCQLFLKAVNSETPKCLSYNLHTELCQFLALVNSQKKNFQHVSRLTSLLRESLEQQGVCYARPQPFQNYQLQTNQVWSQRYQTPQTNTYKQQCFQSVPNMNWPQWNMESSQGSKMSQMDLDFPQGSQMPQMNLDFPQGSQGHLYFTEGSQSQLNQDWSNSNIFQPQLQEITRVQTLQDSKDLVEVHTLPIGQGDCNIITCNKGKNVIIFDCGSIYWRQFSRKKRLQVH